jgi:hypothetical protein
MARDGHSANISSTPKKAFLGDFFAPAKKLPALRRGSSALQASKAKKELDSGLTSSAVVKLFAGTTS